MNDSRVIVLTEILGDHLQRVILADHITAQIHGDLAGICDGAAPVGTGNIFRADVKVIGNHIDDAE